MDWAIERMARSRPIEELLPGRKIVLARMFQRRLVGYRSIGYQPDETGEDTEQTDSAGNAGRVER